MRHLTRNGSRWIKNILLKRQNLKNISMIEIRRNTPMATWIVESVDLTWVLTERDHWTKLAWNMKIGLMINSVKFRHKTIACNFIYLFVTKFSSAICIFVLIFQTDANFHGHKQLWYWWVVLLYSVAFVFTVLCTVRLNVCPMDNSILNTILATSISQRYY